MSITIAVWAIFGLVGGVIGAATYSNPQNGGSAPPNYGSAPSSYGSALPNYGSAPSNYGSAPSSYGSAPPAYAPAPADSGYNGAKSNYGNNGADAELDSLKSQINSLEGRKVAQVSRLHNLAASAAANVAVKNNYLKFVSQQISNEQNNQAKRLESLAEKIAAIRKLREVVKQLDIDANAAKEFNQKLRLNEFENQINTLKDNDIRQNTLIKELGVRAANVADRIDAVIVTSNSERRDLLLIESQARDAFNTINRVKATSFSVTVSTNKPNPAKIIYNQEFIGAPQFFSYNPVGFKLVRKYNNYASGYQNNYGNSNNGYSGSGNYNSGYSGNSNTGYSNGPYSQSAGYSAYPKSSAVSYSLDNFVFNDFASIFIFDESSGDWRVETVDIRATAIYFEPDLLPRITG